jgi:acetylornithine/N-succinyldiaminopimelate aminotransferase
MSSHLLNPYAQFPIEFVCAKGTSLFDTEGREYLDFFSGISCTNLGHAHENVLQAFREQGEMLWHVSNLFPCTKRSTLADSLTKNLSFDARVFFANSGAEANEAAIKLARKYTKEQKHTNAIEIIAFDHSFHGRTLATLSITGKSSIRTPFDPLLSGVHFAQYNDIESVKSLLSSNTSAIILETIQAEGGVFPADKEFLRALRDICDQEKILLLFDEVQTGMGRTGTLFSFESLGVEPDIFTLAKALGNGFPVGAMISKSSISESFSVGDHGTTFGGNPLAMAVSLAVVNEFNQSFLLQVQKKAELLKTGIIDIQKIFPKNIREVRGRGMLLGIEMINDQAKKIQSLLLSEYRIVVILAGNGNVLRLLPPLTICAEEIQSFLTALEDAIAKTL